MSLSRRNFLRSLALGVVGSTIDVDRLLWVPGAKKIFIPSEAQLRFLAADKLMLYGIPYHASDASTGQWLGISRIVGIHEEVLEMIKLLEADKNG